MNNLSIVYRFLFRKSIYEKALILRVVLLYIKVSLIIQFFPLRKYIFKYFINEINFRADLQPLLPHIRLINRVLDKLPGKPTCLKRSIIVHLYYKNHDITIPLHLGVKTEGGFQAHAWYNDDNSNGFRKIDIYDRQEEKNLG